MRILVLCTHNSARSQMAEGLIRHHARERRTEIEVHSAGTERTFVKADAVRAMAEVGIDIGEHTSKRLDEVPEPWRFDLVLTVCDFANDACPAYPASTVRRHVSLPDPSGAPLARWRQVRDALSAIAAALLDAVDDQSWPSDAQLDAIAARVLGDGGAEATVERAP
jgi:arsenate reductase (thioredoxin)